MILEKELATYQRELPALLKEHEGLYVLIQGDQVDSLWPSDVEAVQAGDQRFGLQPFLVKKIEREETPLKTVAPVVP